jgi:tetratricopeptide (TPR) repeat protein
VAQESAHRGSPSRPGDGVWRIARIVLAVGVASAAGWLLATGAPEALQRPNPSPAATVPELEGALRESTISPFRWLELAEGYEEAGDLKKARLCFERAEVLGPNIPPVWIRAAAFYFRQGERDQGLQRGVRAQAVTDTADAFLFQYYDRFVQDTPMVIRTIGGDRRSLEAYLKHLMARSAPDDAALAWEKLHQVGSIDRSLTVSYVEFLMDQGRHAAAQQVWVQETPAEVRRDYPAANRIFNGGFEEEPSGSRLDWKLSRVQAAELERDDSTSKEGKYSMRVTFEGKENTDFQNVVQSAVITPGTYQFSAWIKSKGISTDEGVRFCISDPLAPKRLEVSTDSVRGSNDWVQIRHTIAVGPATGVVQVSVCRRPSIKFDNKIAGTVWIDAVSLTPVR